MSWISGHSITISNNPVYEYIHAKNNLRVLLCPVPGAKVCAYMRAVNAGSKDEAGCVPSGAAHFIEHMSFRIQNGKIWTLASKGDVINAETNFDSTRFYVVHLPHQTAETIAIDAQRFGEKSVPADKVSVERHAVINELERGEQAGNRMFRTTGSVAILEHSYHGSTIGTRSDVDNTKASDMEHFRSKFYVPNNTTLIFSGAFEPQTVLDTVETHFGQMPMGLECNPVHSPEPVQQGMRTVDLNINAPCPMVCMAFRQPKGSTRESLIMQCIAKMTWNNKEGRAKNLITNNVLHDVSTYSPRQLEPYLWFFHGTMETPDTTVEQHMLDVLQTFTSRPPTSTVLNNVKNSLRDEWNRSSESVTDIMNELGRGVSIGNWKDFEDRHHALDTITPNDVATLAATVFTKENMTVTRVLPTSTPRTGLQTTEMVQASHVVSPPVHKLVVRPQVNDWSMVSVSKAMNILQVPRAQYVRATLSTRFSPAQHDIASLFVSNLGTGIAFNGQSNTSLLSALHAERTFSHDHEFLHMTMAMPTVASSINQASSIMFENEWLNPVFKEEEVELQKRHMISEIHSLHADQKFQVKSTFIQSLFEKTMYHVPLSTRIQRLSSLSTSDLNKFHQDWLMNNCTYVTIVAPTREIATTVQETLPSHTETPATTLAWVSKKRQASEQHLVLPGFGSFQIMIGQTVKLASRTDEVALQCAAEILGGGMTGRLMHVVREQRGLGTYGLYAVLQTVSTQTDKIFGVQGTFSPSSLKEGMACTRQLLNEWHEHGVSPHELADAKDKLIGSRLIAADTVDNLHSFVVKSILQHKDPKQDFQEFEHLVRHLTLEQVNHAITTYIDPTKMSSIVVGPE
jgi:zinc protease